jgi:hypothetical protein
MRGRTFRLSTATIAIGTNEKAIMVHAGSIISVLSESDHNKRVYVLYEGHRVQMFEQDIRERGTPVVADAASG